MDEAYRTEGGPLAPYEDALRAELTATGYTDSSVTDVVRTMGRLSMWLRAADRAAADLTPTVVDEFLALRREHSTSEMVARRGVGPLLRFLRGAGAAPDRGEVHCSDQVAALLVRYRAWLVDERGLASESVRCYCGQAKKFLVWLPAPLDAALARLDAATVTAFVVDHTTAAESVWSAKALVTALRSLLRFLHVDGMITGPLTGAVPAVAGWGLAGLPRGLHRDQVAAVLAGPNTATPAGLRDHAILTVLARLGLRGAEAAALGLTDVDWHAGEIIVRGKGSTVERIPLPVEVGTALAEYLTKGRPPCSCSALFVTARAP